MQVPGLRAASVALLTLRRKRSAYEPIDLATRCCSMLSFSGRSVGDSARFNDGRFRVTTEAKLRPLARFGCSMVWRVLSALRANPVELTVKSWEVVGYFALSGCGRGVAPVSSTLWTRDRKGPPTLCHQRQLVEDQLSPSLDGRLVVIGKKPVHEGPAQTVASPQAVPAFRVQALERSRGAAHGLL